MKYGSHHFVLLRLTNGAALQVVLPEQVADVSLRKVAVMLRLQEILLPLLPKHKRAANSLRLGDLHQTLAFALPFWGGPKRSPKMVRANPKTSSSRAPKTHNPTLFAIHAIPIYSESTNSEHFSFLENKGFAAPQVPQGKKCCSLDLLVSLFFIVCIGLIELSKRRQNIAETKPKQTTNQSKP